MLDELKARLHLFKVKSVRFSKWDLYSDPYPDLKSEDPADPEPDPDPRINVTRSRIRILIINFSMVGSGSRIMICISSRVTDHIGSQDPFTSLGSKIRLRII